mmetsp:Transcript_4997/g.10666  ORF Transcript_4997/g.10666 Transcript_4997/m.10666 type:complete len:691 (+) Transcript_4997:215-2287(+)
MTSSRPNNKNHVTKLIALLSITSPAFLSTHVQVQAQNNDNTLFSQQQCNDWLDLATSSDADSSNGLSEQEFYLFLTSITTPSYIADYFSSNNFSDYASLPWTFRIIHKSLACRCQYFGFGENCCLGEGNAEVSLSLEDLDIPEEEKLALVAEYRDDVCREISFALGELIPVPDGWVETTTTTTTSTTAAATTATTATATTTVAPMEETTTTSTTAVETTTTATPIAATTTTPDLNPPLKGPPPIQFNITGSVIDYSTYDGISFNTSSSIKASDIHSNIDQNDVLSDLIFGFGTLTADIVREFIIPMGNSAASIESSEGLVEGRGTGTVDGTGNLGENRRLQGDWATPLYTYSTEEQIADLNDVQVENIFCPDGLVYAPKDQLCLLFKISVTPVGGGILNRDTMDTFLFHMDSHINDRGVLYRKVTEANSETLITGLGNPGAGIPYGNSASKSMSTDDDAGNGNRVSTGAVLAIIFVVIAVFVTGFVFIYYRKQNEKRRLKQFAGDAVSERDLEAGSVRGSLSTPVRSTTGRENGEDSVKEAPKLEEIAEEMPTKEEQQVEPSIESEASAAPAVVIGEDEELSEKVVEPALPQEEAPAIPISKPMEEESNRKDDAAVTDEAKAEAKSNDSDDDDSSDASSVWSESRAEDSTVNEIVEEEVEEEKVAVGSTLAAMGVASTVATSLYSSPQKE